ncbi:MAG: hypothetical protein QXJ40_06995 [Candidatus Bathyarchaeia archaeon]
MAKMKERNKKLVYVPQYIIDEIIEVSKKRGESISKFVEDALLQTLRIDKAGYDIKKLGALFEVMRASKVLGGVFFPLEVSSYLVQKTSASELKDLHRKWLKTGEWYGKYLKEKFEDPPSALKLFLEMFRWDLNEVEVKKGTNCTTLICVSSMISLEETEMLAFFMEGIVKGMGFTIKFKDVVKGLVVLEFS